MFDVSRVWRVCFQLSFVVCGVCWCVYGSRLYVCGCWTVEYCLTFAVVFGPLRFGFGACEMRSGLPLTAVLVDYS